MGGLEISKRKTQKVNVRRALATVALVLVIVGGIAAALFRENLGEIYKAIVFADLKLVFLAVGLYFLEVLFWADRWRMALAAAGYTVGLKSLYLISHGGMFFSNITPISKSGGEPFRAYFIKKTQKIPYPTGFATILAEGLLTIPVVFGVLLAGAVLWLHMQSPPIWLVVAVIGVLVFMLVALPALAYRLIKRKTASKSIFRMIRGVTGLFGRKTDEKKIARSLNRFYASTQMVMRDKRKAAAISAIALSLYLMSIVRIWVILFALGWQAPPAAPLLAATAPLLAGLIPFLPGGLLIIEASMTAVFIACGIPLIIAISATLVERAISYVLSTLAGAVAVSYLGVKIWKASW